MAQPDKSVSPTSGERSPEERTDQRRSDGSTAEPPAPMVGNEAELAVAETLDGSITRSLPPVQDAEPPFPVFNWDRYEFAAFLGQGGMGAVYKARDRRLGRTVALKFIRDSDERHKQRFVQEARAQASIEHPNICKVYETGEIGKKAYIAMQYIDGPALTQVAPSMSLIAKVQVIRDIALALHAAHEQGIIHRDIKPANVMLEPRPDGKWQPLLMDFGLARESNENHGLTESGAVIGTPGYMSPEQARGETRRLDRRSDVYSLGATLYELLSGKPPFQGETVVDVLLQVLSDEPAPLRSKQSEFPEALDIIAGKCLCKEPERRYATAKDLADDLDRFLNQKKIQATKLGIFYRIRQRARRNKPAAVAVSALLLSLLILAGYGIRNRIIALKKEHQAQQQATLARRLGQAIEQMDSLAQLSYAMPLHDTNYEHLLIRERMADLDREIRSYGEIGQALADYSLGRGHLALHEWKQAHFFLSRAESGGFIDPDLDYALGRALGELYREALTSARRSGDHAFFLKQRQELAQQYMVPALTHLERSRKRESISTNYIEGLLDFYNERYDSAISHAKLALRQAPWQYDCHKLAGDVHLSHALNLKDHGDYAEAEQRFKDAMTSYAIASDMGRSDYQIYETMSEVVIRQMEMDSLQRKDANPRLAQALLFADMALMASPLHSSGYAKKAFAYLFSAQHATQRDTAAITRQTLEDVIQNGKLAIQSHPEDEYAHDAIGNAYVRLASLSIQEKTNPDDLLASARQFFEKAIAINSRFPWALNDLGISYLITGEYKLARFENPIEEYQKALDTFSKAAEIDPSYSYAYANGTIACANAAQFFAETGRDPTSWIEKASQLEAKANSINKTNIVSQGMLIEANIKKTIYDINTGIDITEQANKILRMTDRLMKLNDKIDVTYQQRATIFYLIATQQMRAKTDPSDSVSRGLAELEICQRMNNGTDGGCASMAALLSMISTEWRHQERLAPDASLSKTLDFAKHAAQWAPTNTEIQTAVAEVQWRVARLKLSLGQPTAQAIADGLAAIDQALLRTPTWPRALAIQGALHALRARTTPLASDQERARSRAERSLLLAAQGNPHMKTAYREAYQALTTLRSP